MKRNGQKRGIALIMALYLTAVVFVLGTFFIADQLNKSRSVGDYKNSKMALESANMGLNYILNYMGDLNDHWSDAILLARPTINGVQPVCGGDEENIIWPGSPNTINLSGGPVSPPFPVFATQFLGPAAGTKDPNLYENDYHFWINNLITLSAPENIVAQVQGTLQIFYNKNLVPATETCPGGTATNPFAVTNIKVTVFAALYHTKTTRFSTTITGNPLATRLIQWTGLRNVGVYVANYQCWVCWDVPGNKYPNATEGTDSSSFITNGFQSNAAMLALGQTSTTSDHQSGALNPWQSLYGINHNGVINITVNNPSSTNPSVPALNGLTMAYNNINVKNNTANPWSIANEHQDKTIQQPFITGVPFGPTSQAPSILLNNYSNTDGTGASNDPGCVNGGSNKTVFVASSMDVGAGLTSSGAPAVSGHDFEYDPTGAHPNLQPAVADVTFNNNATVTVTTTGYYSGQIIQQYTDTVGGQNGIQNGILYFAGFKNVRVHGQLNGASISVIADQGEAVYNGTGQDVTPAATNNCVAPNLNLSNAQSFTRSDGTVVQPNSLASAERYSSDQGAGSSVGWDYWIPGATHGAASSYPQGSGTGCMSCTYDGIYYDANGSVVGYHVDDVNGQPLYLNPAQTTTCESNCGSTSAAAMPTLQTTDVQGFYGTMYLPPPTQVPASGAFTGSAAPGSGSGEVTSIVPATVQLMQNGTVVASKVMAPYPGASALIDLENQPNQTPDNLFYTREFEQSEGNLTASGDVGFQGQGNALGLMARNYVILNDFTADSKQSTQDYSLQVRANIISTDKSVQWEGLVAQDSNPAYSPFVNGDYVAMNNQYRKGSSTTKYTYTYTDQTGATHTVNADGWQGAPLSQSNASPLLTQPNPSKNQWWQFHLYGTMQAEYEDVVNYQDSGGNYLGYAKELLDIDRSNFYGPPPGFPNLSFQNYQLLQVPAFYITLSYNDLGALQSYGP